MKIPRSIRILCVFALTLSLSNIPAVATAGMISTQELAQELSGTEARQELNDLLARADVRSELVARGLQPEEVSARLASLSETEVQQLSKDIQQARAGGDILITVLIVVLIIFLIKRI